MKRSKALIVILGTSALLAIATACIVIIHLRAGEQRFQALKIIDEVLERQRIRHERIGRARARLPQDSALPGDWSLEQAMVAWQGGEIEALAALAKRFSQDQEVSADDKAKITRFVTNSPELGELLEAIECGLCEIRLDPAKGQWQISSAQIRALRSMAYMLAARAILLAEKGDSDGALKTILNSYALMDVLSDTPNIHLQSYRPGMLSYIERAISRALNPDKIPDDSKAALLRYLERQSSTEPIVNALKLHEALVRQEVSTKHSAVMESWLLAGYHEGIKHILQSLNEPQSDSSERWKTILDEAPLYAGQTKWRLRNVAPDALQARDNLQRHARSVRDFLQQAIEPQKTKPISTSESPEPSEKLDTFGPSGKIGLRILYAGLMETDRTKDFAAFLAAHFEEVETADYLTFKEAESAGFDVTIIDHDGVDSDASIAVFKLSNQYVHAAIAVGAPGAQICSQLSLKTAYM